MSTRARLAAPAGRILYENAGNPALLALLDPGCGRLLDVGCGAGDNARLLKARDPSRLIHGITHDPGEATRAAPHLDRCWVFDVEQAWPAALEQECFDTLLFSHVLEHLREPSQSLARFCRLLRPGGSVLIAVPNVLSWRQRLEFLSGRFEYTAAGVLDATHLRFFTYLTADRHLLREAPHLVLEHKRAEGSLPLWWLRRHVLPEATSTALDALGCRAWPNLFGAQVLLKARLR